MDFLSEHPVIRATTHQTTEKIANFNEMPKKNNDRTSQHVNANISDSQGHKVYNKRPAPDPHTLHHHYLLILPPSIRKHPLINTLSKLIEKVINKRLNWILESTNVLLKNNVALEEITQHKTHFPHYTRILFSYETQPKPYHNSIGHHKSV